MAYRYPPSDNDTHLVKCQKNLVTHLTSLGYTVVVRTDKEVLATDAVGKNLVIISESVLSTNVNTKLRNVAVPLLTWEGWVLDDLRMTGPVAYTDYGEV